MIAPLLASILAFSVLSGPFAAAQSPAANAIQKAFAGTWREDVSQRKLDASSAPPARFRKSETGGIEELRGPIDQPTVQPVVFDAKPRQLPSGNSYVWRQLGPRRFERVSLSSDGQVIATRRLTLADDGKTLTEDSETKSTDGFARATIVYQRSSTESEGLVGTWKLTTMSSGFATEVTFEPEGATRLRKSPNQGPAVTLEIDGPPVPVTGLGSPKGATEQLHAVNAATIEITAATNGVEQTRTTYTLLPDGRSMRMSITALRGPASATPVEMVLVRQ